MPYRIQLPARMRVSPGRIVISVHDQGRGPAGPLAGLVPAASNAATLGLGLWLIHQLDIEVALRQRC
jgi:anti-sigma regulatory factor (Ser/Thr protein kinase)